eukprot:COSAG06_NODE_3851_length_4829_cov_4.730021_6_plen_57_part_01
MPLFTTWYALIPGIILCLRGGIRPYAPPQRVDVETGMLRGANVKVVDADIEGREDQ